MRYMYKCNDDTCSVGDMTILKPMSECSKVELCPNCKKPMVRVYKTAISTSDGFKN